MFSLTSDCQREAFRFYPVENIKLKHEDKDIPISNISINGMAFKCENYSQGDCLDITIQLADDIIIDATIIIVHLSSSIKEPVCGSKFLHISNDDRELINLYVLHQQKIQIRQQL